MLFLDVANNYSDYAASAIGIGLFFFWMLFCAVLCIVPLIGLYKIFKKAGKPGWAVIVPFYNTYLMYEIAWGNGLTFLATLVPGLNVLASALTCAKLAKVFGKGSSGMIILSILFTPIFLLIIGFGDAQYLGLTQETKLFPNSTFEDQVSSFKL